MLNGLFEDSLFNRDAALAKRHQEALSHLSADELSSTGGGTVEIFITEGRSRFALGSQLADDLAVGAGEVLEFVGRNIEENPFLKYGLTTLDIAAGPAAFAIRELVSSIPAVQQAQEQLFEIGKDRFIDVGDGEERANSGGGGTLGLGSLILGGALAVIRAAKRFDVSFGSKRTGNISVTENAKIQANKSPAELSKLRRLEASANELSNRGFDVRIEGEGITGQAGELVISRKDFGNDIPLEAKRLDSNTNRAIQTAISKGTKQVGNNGVVLIDGTGAGIDLATFQTGFNSFKASSLKSRIENGSPGNTGKILFLFDSKGEKVIKF